MATTPTTPLEEGWFYERERAVAWLRVAFAVLAVFVIQLNPSRVAVYPWLSAVSLVSFLLYSAAILYIVLWRKFTTLNLGTLTTSLDVVWIALIVFSTGGTRTPFFFYYSFPVITAALRWGLKGSIPVAAFGVTIYAAIRLSLLAESSGEPIGIDTIVVRSLYLMVLAGIFGYISEFEKRQNQKLLTLSQTAGQVAALKERRRITYELHDNILQSLATLLLRLESTRTQLQEPEKRLAADLEDMEQLTRDSMTEIRRFLSGKDPSPLPPGALLQRVKEELHFLQKDLGTDVVLEVEPEEIDLPEAVEREVYLVLREGLTNITRHAHASRIALRLTQRNDTLEAKLEDNGVGLSPEFSQNGNGLGLRSMRERIERLGGKLSISSSPAAGTKINLAVPLAV